VIRGLSALGAGLLFGVGLWLSGLADPRNVLGFLDVSGEWNPSLLLVMAAAVAVAFAGPRLAATRSTPLLEPRFDVPARREIDARLLAGATLFGVGWGMTGYCPGPGIASLATLDAGPLVFVAAMLAGGLAHRYMPTRRASSPRV
jgi:uncharacterized protein